MFSQQIVNGLAIGATYALMAVGYSLVYSILRFTNFAHGAVVMFSAYAAYFAVVYLQPRLSVAVLVAMATGAAVSSLYEKLVYRTMRRKKSRQLYLMIAGLGISVIIENLVIAFIGGRFKAYPVMLGTKPVQLAGVSVPPIDVSILGVSLLTLASMTLLIEGTKIGLAIRASSFNMETVSLMGVNVNALVTMVFAIAGALAGLSGVFLGAKYTVYPQLGSLATKAFISSIFGGMGSMPGAVLGALLLGSVEALVAGYVSSSMRDVFSFMLLILILVFRPTGLLGKRIIEKA